MSGIERLHSIMVRLRDPETGCPWDRVQTLSSLKPCLLEETYELLSAMDRPEDRANYVEELGDVLLQVMFQCVMAEQEGRFTFDDVANAISDKLVRRHPHVFGDVVARDPATVLKNWEQIKQQEHRKESRHSALDGVPPVLPGLLKAQRTQEKAARVGFDWKDADGPREKIREEAAELDEAVAASADTSLDPHVKRERPRRHHRQVCAALPRRGGGGKGRRTRPQGDDARRDGRPLGRRKGRRRRRN